MLRQREDNPKPFSAGPTSLVAQLVKLLKVVSRLVSVEEGRVLNTLYMCILALCVFEPSRYGCDGFCTHPRTSLSPWLHQNPHDKP